MNTSNSNSGKLAGASILSAVAASLCCITLVVAFLAGTASVVWAKMGCLITI